MNRKLSKLEPVQAMHFFEDICNIPHGSRQCNAISDYCVNFAEERNLKVIKDKVGNVIIYKKPSKGREKDTTVMLQAHLDMVCDKTKESHFDFKTDPLRLEIDGDFISSKNTTLGADDGIGVAMILALLDDDKLNSPAIEAVFTVDEEIGLLGAKELDLSNCNAQYLINLDSEDDNVLWSGCAGGAVVTSRLPIFKENFKGEIADLTVYNLKGGHSGADIHLERGNANALMGRVLNEINNICLLSLIDLNGGTADNAIPNMCKASISLAINDQYFIDTEKMGLATEEYKERKLKEINDCVSRIYNEVSQELSESDSDVRINIDVRTEKTVSCVNAIDTQKIIFFLLTCPNGVINMSTKIDDLVETSSNMAIVNLEHNNITFTASVRSSVESRKQQLIKKIVLISKFLGADSEVSGEYPSWNIKKKSELRKVMTKTYKDMFGEKPEVKAIHAGLESGYFLREMPHLDIVSIGPNIYDIHTTNERLSIQSTRKMYKYLVKVLASVK